MASKFKVKVVSLERLIISPSGATMPLCESCDNRDCGNPIVDKDVSVFGVRKKLKCYSSGFEPKIVVACEGYIHSKKD